MVSENFTLKALNDFSFDYLRPLSAQYRELAEMPDGRPAVAFKFFSQLYQPPPNASAPTMAVQKEGGNRAAAFAEMMRLALKTYELTETPVEVLTRVVGPQQHEEYTHNQMVYVEADTMEAFMDAVKSDPDLWKETLNRFLDEKVNTSARLRG